MLNRSCIRWPGVFFACAVWLVIPVFGFPKNPADEHVQLELISEQNAVVPGKELWFGIRIDLQDGWHTYWTNPGDSGEAARIDRRGMKQERFNGPTPSAFPHLLLQTTAISIRFC